MDLTDRAILEILQADCKVPLARIGKEVGLSPPAVAERIRKLEGRGVVRGYHARVDPAAMGLDITAFIGLSFNFPRLIGQFEERVAAEFPEILECHHVTGGATLLLKVKARNTAALEGILSRLRELDGVERTETTVVLSTRWERTGIPLGAP